MSDGGRVAVRSSGTCARLCPRLVAPRAPRPAPTRPLPSGPTHLSQPALLRAHGQPAAVHGGVGLHPRHTTTGRRLRVRQTATGSTVVRRLRPLHGAGGGRSAVGCFKQARG